MNSTTKQISIEIRATTGIHFYTAIGETKDKIYNLQEKTLLGEPLRYNLAEDRIEYLKENGHWDVYISDGEILEVDIKYV